MGKKDVRPNTLDMQCSGLTVDVKVLTSDKVFMATSINFHVQITDMRLALYCGEELSPACTQWLGPCVVFMVN
jgi:hypothetical protein